MMYSQNQNESD